MNISRTSSVRIFSRDSVPIFPKKECVIGGPACKEDARNTAGEGNGRFRLKGVSDMICADV